MVPSTSQPAAPPHSSAMPSTPTPPYSVPSMNEIAFSREKKVSPIVSAVYSTISPIAQQFSLPCAISAGVGAATSISSDVDVDRAHRHLGTIASRNREFHGEAKYNPISSGPDPTWYHRLVRGPHGHIPPTKPASSTTYHVIHCRPRLLTCSIDRRLNVGYEADDNACNNRLMFFESTDGIDLEVRSEPSAWHFIVVVYFSLGFMAGRFILDRCVFHSLKISGCWRNSKEERSELGLEPTIIGQHNVNHLDVVHELINTVFSTALKESKPIYISITSDPSPNFLQGTVGIKRVTKQAPLCCLVDRGH
ncbi:pyruvate decarboxylase, partial [Striga asiatica]